MRVLLFEQMNLIKPLLDAIKQCGYQEPTPIQRETIPPVLKGRDVLGCAQTGTGKTAAFALPILQRLSQNKAKAAGRPIRTLILTPTRELALQIYENFLAYGKKLSLRSCVIFGGVGQQPQVDALKKGVDILVATPGRLNDLIGQGYISLANLEIFVLDEADRMLDMGFIHDVKRVIAKLPEQRQTLLFSATMPAEVEKLALSILTEPVSVKVDPVSSTVDAIRQYLYLVDKANKKHLLADLLKKPNIESALVFTRTKHGADRVVRELSKAGIAAKAIHGDKSQNARQEALSQFKKGKINVLIATDIAARGIDIAGLSHVFNYDLPNEAESYVHRIGRTGRAGRPGVAISFCCIDEMKLLADIEKLTNKKLTRLESAWPMLVLTETVKQPKPPRKEKNDAQPKQGKESKQAKPEPKSATQKEKVAKKGKPAEEKLEKSASQPSKKKQGKEKKAEVIKPAPEQKAHQNKPAQKDRAEKGKPQHQPEHEKKSAAEKKHPSASMKATLLERPAASKATLLERSLGTRTPAEKKQYHMPEATAKTEETLLSYQKFMAKQRQSRAPLATGDDRR